MKLKCVEMWGKLRCHEGQRHETRRIGQLASCTSLACREVFLSSSLHYCNSSRVPQPHNTGKMSAIYEEPGEGEPNEPVKVLITLHEGMDAMDVVGPLEVFSWAQHDKQNPGTL